MITLAPIPTLGELFRLMLPAHTSLKQFSHIWIDDSRSVGGWLSRSAWSLALIAEWRRQFKNYVSISVWVPDYFCNQSLFLLRKMGVNLHFYPILNDLTPDYSAVRRAAKDGKPDIFLLVHYFGRPTPTPAAADFCKHADAWLVEDATHVPFPLNGVGTAGDFVLYSPHKIFAIPDGALLIARPNGVGQLGDAFLSDLGPTNKWASHALKALPAVRFNQYSSVWLIKRALQRCGLVRPATRLPDHNASISPVFPPPVISRISEKLLCIQLSSVSTVRSARLKNKLLLDYLISESEMLTGLKPIVGNSFDSFPPYLARYIIAAGERLVQKSREMGLFATTWPDLSPEVESNPERHVHAIEQKKSTLFLPIHQTIVSRDFLNIFPLEASHSTNLILKDWLGTDEAWNSTLGQVGVSNLLQSWEYGQAKHSASGWNIRRFSLKKEGRLVGIVQVLERRFLGLISIYRINRGPVFLLDTPLDSRSAANHLVRKTFGRFWLGKILLWAPELTLSGKNLAFLLSIGLRERAVKSWSSSVIDLSQTEERLQMCFSRNWRSMLRVAQSRQISVEISDNKEEFASLVARCAQIMNERGVKLQVKLFSHLREILSNKPKSDLFLVARDKSEIIAAVYIVAHGNTATYLMGWNGPQGRLLCAHHLLLWEGIRQLKAMSILHFDLGGIDQENTPGIAAFKLGMGGERYQLVGEGICY